MPTTNNASAHAQSTSSLYDILGVERTATTDEISAAYKKAAKKHHPDRHSTKEPEEAAQHAELFKNISHAHEILSDGDKRAKYDMFGEAGVGGASQGADAAEAAMFEAMFGVGAGAGAPRNRRMAGGALFVDSSRGGQFFQRSWEVDEQTLDLMRSEMAQGLPDIVADGTCLKTTVPHGVAWEVRLVESDPPNNTLTVMLTARADKEADGELDLRVERTFSLPAGVHPDAVDVALDANVLVVTTTREALPTAETPSPKPSVDELFVVGDDLKAAAPKTSNRAARRRAKQEGLKSGFLHAKPKRSKAGVARKENEPAQVVEPPIERRASKSPVSVREDIDAAMRAQVDELMTNA